MGIEGTNAMSKKKNDNGLINEEEQIDLDDLLKRVLYPKIKGQRGGGFVWSDVERTQIDVLAGNIKPKRSKPMKKLKQFTKLFNLRHRRRNSKVKNEYVLSPQTSPKMDVEEEEYYEEK